MMDEQQDTSEAPGRDTEIGAARSASSPTEPAEVTAETLEDQIQRAEQLHRELTRRLEATVA